MTTAQLLSIGIIALMMAAFVWGRLRYDLVAACALLVAVAVGVVPFDKAFRGFGDDVVIAGSVSNDEAKQTYPDGWKEPRPYIRIVPQPS